jgi:2-amino-4-hydroxy-6-hydroxymethyldihydropteridine diphosphokinase
MSCAYIGLGSNLAQPMQQLQRALATLRSLATLKVVTVSSFYRSAPLDGSAQPDYLNAVAQIDTSLAPLALLHQLQHIENEQGRERAVRWGARTLDLDLLLVDQIQLHSVDLTLPHPGLTLREFVVFPLLEIAPNLVLPSGIALHDCAAALQHKPLQRITND